jgi:hypothetical protein
MRRLCRYCGRYVISCSGTYVPRKTRRKVSGDDEKLRRKRLQSIGLSTHLQLREKGCRESARELNIIVVSVLEILGVADAEKA